MIDPSGMSVGGQQDTHRQLELAGIESPNTPTTDDQSIADAIAGAGIGTITIKVKDALDLTAEVLAKMLKWAAAGRQGEAVARNWLIQNGYIILAEQLFVKTPIGVRITDFVVTGGKAGDTIAAFEVKVNGPTRSPLQAAKDSLIQSPGGEVRTIGHPIFPQGMHIQYDTGLMYVELTP